MLSHFDIIAMKDITLRILDMECAACVSRLDRALLRLPGIKKAAVSYALNSTPFVRQYDILSKKWGVLLCQREYQTNDIRRNSKNWS